MHCVELWQRPHVRVFWTLRLAGGPIRCCIGLPDHLAAHNTLVPCFEYSRLVPEAQ